MKEYNSKKSCDETTCGKLRATNIAYRYYNPKGGPEEEGWSMLSDCYEFEEKLEDGDIEVTTELCFAKIKRCPFCAKSLSATPDKSRVIDGLTHRK